MTKISPLCIEASATRAEAFREAAASCRRRAELYEDSDGTTSAGVLREMRRTIESMAHEFEMKARQAALAAAGFEVRRVGEDVAPVTALIERRNQLFRERTDLQSEVARLREALSEADWQIGRGNTAAAWDAIKAALQPPAATPAPETGAHHG